MERDRRTGGVTREALDDNRTVFAGTDLYLKWRDLSSVAYLAIQAEYILRRALIPGGNTLEGGLYAQVDWRVNRSWQLSTRGDWFGAPAELNATESDSEASGLEDEKLDRLLREVDDAAAATGQQAVAGADGDAS